eukprot:CAMPEP_0118702326 /NCGR_PEP_ID=MMETSP0800-20121206/17822_1 /TAXON_ID=210618 ORGANISM="Striatella unipunctata, Strain CCMP2910" /NCGR_SAMPLE_ID=MMETSP0800 /ASSEMBLY_ACC=CAM_ASM_000638 /LENGTH=442 /DNA_ID=CAMNT_0006603501 /DNA_START=148 /DNA_END=1476 /DNA_ORIENTATION=+
MVRSCLLAPLLAVIVTISSTITFTNAQEATWSPNAALNVGLVGDLSGSSVALSNDGTVLAVGATQADDPDEQGYVRVYKLNDGTWTRLGTDIVGENAGDRNGASIDLSDDGNRLVVGSPNGKNQDGQTVGHARVFQLTDNKWLMLGSTPLFGETVDGDMGFSVAISGDGRRVAVGAPFQNKEDFTEYPLTGRVYTFEYDTATTEWNRMFPDTVGYRGADAFGYSIDLNRDGSMLVVGSPFSDGVTEINNFRQSNIGTVTVSAYNETGKYWTEVISIDGEAAGDKSGFSVSISADGATVAIGGPDNGGDTGHVRVFRIVPVEDGYYDYTRVGQDVDGDMDGFYSGYSVALSGDGQRLAVGAIGNFHVARSLGTVGIFALNGTAWAKVGDDIVGEPGARSGSSVALDERGFRVAVGSPYNQEIEGLVVVYDETEVTTSPSISWL